MKKIFTLIVAAIAACSTMSAQQGDMTFVGKSNFYVTQGSTQMGNTDVASDTIIYSGANFTIPSMKYGEMVIPSFTIQETTYSGGYSGVTWEDQTWNATATDATGTEKSITGTSLTGSFTHDGGIYNLKLSITFKYGAMPMPITYTIDGYYVKPSTDKISVMVGGMFGPYTNDNVTYDGRLYTEDGITKLDVTMHGYDLYDTVMGDLTLGEYTVKGLVYDEEKGGYYRNYAADGLTFHFKSSQGMDNDYTFSKGELLVKMDGTTIAYAENTFQPGAMPFPIVATFGDKETAGIESFDAQAVEKIKVRKYIENGMIIIERAGRKYNPSGTIVR